MKAALLALVLTFTPSPDARVIGYQCEAWHVSTWTRTPWRVKTCDVRAPMQVSGDWTAEIPDESAGWFVVFCLRSRTCCDLSECADDIRVSAGSLPTAGGDGAGRFAGSGRFGQNVRRRGHAPPVSERR